MGMHLRVLAQKYDLAVVVSNQVADRFSSNERAVTKTPASSLRVCAAPAPAPPITNGYQDSPLLSRSRNVMGRPTEPSSSIPDPSSSMPMPYIPPPENPLDAEYSYHPALMLDHQQRWFTGWGDDPLGRDFPLKTPSLGLVWSTQISGRIALFRRPVHSRLGVSQGWKRWMKVVWGGDMVSFLSSTATKVGKRKGKGKGDGQVEFEVWMGGLRGVGDKEEQEKEKEEKAEEEL
jgi:DNA repair protein RAD57